MSPSCPVGTKVSKQTTLTTGPNTLSCYDANGVIIGSPIPNTPIPNICTTEARFNNYLTHIDTGQIVCNIDGATYKNSNPCPAGINLLSTPELKLDGTYNYVCLGSKPDFKCLSNVQPIIGSSRWGTTTTCNILPTSRFTSDVYDFKSKREHKVESFSQNNNKCKARY
jgi:hypothetical protein